MSHQIRLESYFLPTVWWESYCENGQRTKNVLKTNGNSDCVNICAFDFPKPQMQSFGNRMDIVSCYCTLKETTDCYIVLSLVNFIPDTIVKCYQCTSRTILSVVSELFLWMQNKLGNQGSGVELMIKLII